MSHLMAISFNNQWDIKHKKSTQVGCSLYLLSLLLGVLIVCFFVLFVHDVRVRVYNFCIVIRFLLYVFRIDISCNFSSFVVRYAYCLFL